MSKTELLELLRKEDEWTLLELLEVNSEDIVDAFPEKIQENLERIYRHYND